MSWARVAVFCAGFVAWFLLTLWLFNSPGLGGIALVLVPAVLAGVSYAVHTLVRHRRYGLPASILMAPLIVAAVLLLITSISRE